MYFITFAIGLALDQLVKYWALTKLSLVGSIPLIQGFFHLTYAENRGAAFSMFDGARWFLVAVAVVFLIIISMLLKRNFFTTWWSKMGVALLSAGALGNVIDRARLGFVVDLFDFKAINFAIFNVADMFITMGGILVALYIIFVEGKKGKI